MKNITKEMFSFAEQFPVPMFKVDASSNIHYCNSAASKKLGYKKSELVKRNAYDLFQEKDHPQLKERLSNITKNTLHAGGMSKR